MARLRFKIGKYQNGVGLSRAFDTIDRPLKAWGMLQYREILNAFQLGGHAHHKGTGYILGAEATTPDRVDKWKRLNPDYERWKIAHLRGEIEKKKEKKARLPRPTRAPRSRVATLFKAIRKTFGKLSRLLSGGFSSSTARNPRRPKAPRAPQKILVLTGRLKNSITSNVEILGAARAQVILGTNVEYGEKHQLGVGVPARPFIVVSTLDRTRMEKQLLSYFTKHINGVPRGNK